MKKKIALIFLNILATVTCAFGVAACDTTPDSGEDNPPAHTHSWSSTYYTEDGDRHYQTCSGCDEKQYAQHSYNTDGVCVCGKQKPAQGEDNPPVHTHTYDKQVVEEKYLKAAATHATKAIYYLSCECGEKGTKTFENGETIPHTFDKQIAEEKYLKTAATCTTKAVYYLSCECGETGTETFESGATIPHTFDKQVAEEKYLKSAATCTSKAVYYYSCGCGETGTQTFEYGELAAHTLQSHKAQAANCTEVGWEAYESCTLCDYSTYKEIPATGHNWNYEQLNLTHTATCTSCDEVITTTEHTWNDNVCSVCGYDAGGSKGLSWFLSNNEYTVSRIGECVDTEILIPATYNGKPVTSIYDHAFEYCSSFTSITIPDSVTSIGTVAFSECSGLTNVYYTGDIASWCGISGLDNLLMFSDKTLYINNQEIAGALSIPDSVTSISNGAFRGCNGLTSINIPDSVTSIGGTSFWSCSGLESINVGINNTAYSSQDGILYDKAKTKFILIPQALKGDVKIPDGVTWIGRDEFRGCSGLTSITIPDGVTGIGFSAFRDCSGLTSITIPDSVTYIDGYAFSGCSSLTSVTIPDSVTSIGGSAFSGCSSLTSLTIPFVGTSKAGTEYTHFGCIFGAISYNENSNCVPASLKTVVITGGESIGNYAFKGCSGLTSITIPDSVTSIGESAFKGCSGLTSITIPFVGASKDGTENTHFGYIFGANSYSENSNYVPASLKTVVITGGESIGNNAFNNCSGLTSITLPDSVTSIDYSAFEGCSGLTSISVDENNTAYASQDGILYNKAKTEFIHIPAALKGDVAIPDGITGIDDFAFEYRNGLTSITIPDSVTSIGENAFSYCTGLTSITVSKNNAVYGSQDGILYDKAKTKLILIPDALNGDITIASGVTKVSEWAFKNRSGLTNITIPDSVTSIDYGAFYGCSGLTSITVPDSVTSIGMYTFYGCNGLTSITIPFVGANKDGTENTYFSYIFGVYDWNDTKNYVPALLKTVVITGGNIMGAAFLECVSLKQISIGDNVKIVETAAINYCNSLESVLIGAGVTKIEVGAFSNSSNIREFIVNENNIAYSSQDGILFNKEKTEIIRVPVAINQVDILDSVTSIGDGAFSYCQNLTSLIIPDSVTSIGDSVFFGCNSLQFNEYDNALYLGNENNHYVALIRAKSGDIITCKINEKTKFIHSDAFSYCNSLSSISIPNGVMSIGEHAFYNCSGLTSITIPDSVTSIGNKAFYDCGLTKIIIPDSVTNIGLSAFGGSFSSPDNVTLPYLSFADDVESKYFNYIFGGYVSSKIKNIKITSGQIPNNAFNGCSNLTSVAIGNGVTSIGDTAFKGCSIESISVDENNTAYASQDGILYNKEKTVIIHIPAALKGDVTIPDGITSIDSPSFLGYSGLTSISIPDSVTSICSVAFAYCSGLTNINFNGTIEQWNAINKVSGWNNNTGDFTITCTDGKLDKDGNEITA